jgi:ABC-type multidrug transport system fused ATPase/permease subunit
VLPGHKRVGELVRLMMCWRTITRPLYSVSSSHRRTSSLLIKAERLLQLLNTKPTVVDQDGANDLVVMEGKIKFNHVDFGYDACKPLIRDLDLEVEGGQMVAFVGQTGAGKSTILKLLLRFYDVTGGSITIDGQDLRSITQSSLREALGIVPQECALFNISIRENIRYGQPKATDAEIQDACRAAAIHDVIESFPDKYNSIVGERGIKLSGGEIQRISIARMLIKNPKILLLDEATSALDSTTEQQIQNAYRKLSKGLTTVVVAHRLSTIIAADQILVFDDGKIIEQGTHQQLLRLGGKYMELWVNQTGGHPPPDSKSDGSTQLMEVVPASESDSSNGHGVRKRQASKR